MEFNPCYTESTQSWQCAGERDGDVGRDHPPYLLQPRMLHTLTPQINRLKKKNVTYSRGEI
uniref:Uncharacterized protein n=1 Tax=Magallana gigas TaxID=29159 RepID=K1QJK6_MAGGI